MASVMELLGKLTVPEIFKLVEVKEVPLALVNDNRVPTLKLVLVPLVKVVAPRLVIPLM